MKIVVVTIGLLWAAWCLSGCDPIKERKLVVSYDAFIEGVSPAYERCGVRHSGVNIDTKQRRVEIIYRVSEEEFQCVTETYEGIVSREQNG